MSRTLLLGASGLVGGELFSLLKQHQTEPIHTPNRNQLEKLSFEPGDIVFTCLPASVVSGITPRALDHGATIIDLSSQFRNDPTVPLIIPEINRHLLEDKPNLIASPNCVATLLSLALYPLHTAYHITRVVAATYQAASGAGKKGVEALDDPNSKAFPHTFTKNLFKHESTKDQYFYSGEEDKIICETKKLLSYDQLSMNVHAVRVPVLRSHSIYANVAFEKTPEDPMTILTQAPGLTYHPDPTPLDANYKTDVLFGPVRKDRSTPNTIDLWIVGDQLLKGAAYNAFQIYQEIKRFASVS